MAGTVRDPLVRRLDEAEGYLMLDLPERALAILQGRAEWGRMQFEACFLTGEAMRAVGRHREALRPLEQAAVLRPGHFGVAMALAWCYKRTHRLAQAIDALERVHASHAAEPLLHYNLACYWSLARNQEKAVEELTLALELDADLRYRIAGESDFAPIREHPGFRELLKERRAEA